MGNANGKEDADGGGGDADPSVRSGGDFARNNAGRPGRSPSVDSMGNTPPGSPGRSRSPLLFTPQVPLAPLRHLDGPTNYSQMWMNDSHGSLDYPQEKGIPTLITWSHGGSHVAVEGSWDNWSSRKTLVRSGKDFAILLVLPSGVYHYRFVVDGEWRYIPDLPHVADDTGRFSNVLDVTDSVPENLESVCEFELPSSPDSSYSRPQPVDEDFAKEPPVVPQQLHLSVLGAESDDEMCVRPQHVVLNHLFIEKGWASQHLVALGLTHRFQSKYVTVVLYKPLKKEERPFP